MTLIGTLHFSNNSSPTNTKGKHPAQSQFKRQVQINIKRTLKEGKPEKCGTQTSKQMEKHKIINKLEETGLQEHHKLTTTSFLNEHGCTF